MLWCVLLFYYLEGGGMATRPPKLIEVLLIKNTIAARQVFYAS